MTIVPRNQKTLRVGINLVPFRSSAKELLLIPNSSFPVMGLGLIELRRDCCSISPTVQVIYSVINRQVRSYSTFSWQNFTTKHLYNEDRL